MHSSSLPAEFQCCNKPKSCRLLIRCLTHRETAHALANPITLSTKEIYMHGVNPVQGKVSEWTYMQYSLKVRTKKCKGQWQSSPFAGR